MYDIASELYIRGVQSCRDIDDLTLIQAKLALPNAV